MFGSNAFVSAQLEFWTIYTLWGTQRGMCQVLSVEISHESQILLEINRPMLSVITFWPYRCLKPTCSNYFASKYQDRVFHLEKLVWDMECKRERASMSPQVEMVPGVWANQRSNVRPAKGFAAVFWGICTSAAAECWVDWSISSKLLRFQSPIKIKECVQGWEWGASKPLSWPKPSL